MPTTTTVLAPTTSAPTTTAAPQATTTTGPSPLALAVQLPATTVAPAATLPPTTPLTTAPAPITTTTTLAPTTTTTTTTTTLPPAVPTLRVATRDGDPSGPPGVGLFASGENYPCSLVTLEFAGQRLDQASVSGGAFRDSEGDVPGDAEPGIHTVTADCGGPVLASATFRVTDRAIHRPDLVTALPKPGDISLSLGDLAKSAGAALVTLPIIFFPFAVIEEVMDDHYEEIRGWFGLSGGAKDKVGWAAVPAFLAFMGVAAAVYTALDPTAGFNMSTLVIFVGLLAGLCLVVLSEGTPSLLYARRRRLRSPMRALPGSLVLALIVVGLSRLIHFHPGYAFGAVAGFYVAGQLQRRDEGRLKAAAVLSILTVSLLAWLAWAPVSEIASQADAGLGIVVLETALAATFMVGLETCLVLSLPIRFVNGGYVAGWNKWAWAGMFVLVFFPVVHIMFGGSQHTLVTDGVSRAVIIAVMAGFALFTVAFWGYFRFRPERPQQPRAMA